MCLLMVGGGRCLLMVGWVPQEQSSHAIIEIHIIYCTKLRRRNRGGGGGGGGGGRGGYRPPCNDKGGRTYRSAPPLLARVNFIHNPKWCQLRSNIRIAQSINMYNIAVNQIMLTAANCRSRRINCHIHCWLDCVSQ